MAEINRRVAEFLDFAPCPPSWDRCVFWDSLPRSPMLQASETMYIQKRCNVPDLERCQLDPVAPAVVVVTASHSLMTGLLCSLILVFLVIIAALRTLHKTKKLDLSPLSRCFESAKKAIPMKCLLGSRIGSQPSTAALWHRLGSGQYHSVHQHPVTYNNPHSVAVIDRGAFPGDGTTQNCTQESEERATLPGSVTSLWRRLVLGKFRPHHKPSVVRDERYAFSVMDSDTTVLTTMTQCHTDRETQTSRLRQHTRDLLTWLGVASVHKKSSQGGGPGVHRTDVPTDSWRIVKC